MKGWDELQGAAVKEAMRQQLQYEEASVREAMEQQQEYDSTFSPKRHPLSDKFHTVLMELGLLHDKKQKDYGREDDPFANCRGSRDFGVDGWVGTMIRANDKMKRIQKAAYMTIYGVPPGEALANESIIDSFNDLAVYAVIARVLYEEQHAAISAHRG